MITKFEKGGMYRDGGTEELILENGIVVYVDNRIQSTTKGKVFDKYPGKEGAKIIGKMILEMLDLDIIHPADYNPYAPLTGNYIPVGTRKIFNFLIG